jgi:hypothetical protein
MPPDSWTWIQRFENSIIKFFERHRDTPPEHPGAHSERDVQNPVRPRRAPGGVGVFKKAFDNLTLDTDRKGQRRPATLIQAGTNRSGYPLWKLNPDLDQK